MNSSPSIVLRVVLAMMLAGAALRWLEPHAGQLSPVNRATGASAMTIAALGGYRTFAADLAWLRAYAAWEERDGAAMSRWLHATTSLDPEPLAFWLNGARMLAYDMPRWSDASEAGGVASSEWSNDPALALRWLDAAERVHPESPAIWTERAMIQWRALGDVTAAAESYRRAAELPAAPYYAARLHAELLRLDGRPRDAWTFLRELHPRLSPSDPAAMRDVVLARIRELETELDVAEEDAYRPPAP
ncbi:MAG: hypothetical protein NVV63_15595 [Opitutus sp.]|nr:hypothetical protein [Opitutus sp.]